ncbi:MAG: hypothetical protein K9M15_02845 [Candidatus Marinimicrobia bacterium]|nr:hypothetical protein [Candidatus Neomarinimicrobiota bacterium]
MNEHLKPVFQTVLPELEKTQIDYWVYGGVGIVACVGRFIRTNQDVDIFIKDIDFEKARLILEKLCKQHVFEFSLIPSERPKIEIRINKNEIFSMIPVYQEENEVVFKYEKKWGDDQRYSDKILEKVERKILGYKFFTSKDDFIKDMFVRYIKARSDKIKRPKIIKDAKAILTKDKRLELGFTE